MEANELIHFRAFQHEEESAELVELLKDNDIEYKLEEVEGIFDPSFAQTEIPGGFLLLVKPSDIDRIHELINKDLENRLDLLPNDYYLYSFSDKELLDILYRPEEWGDVDALLARKLLKSRNVPLDDAHIEQVKEERELAIVNEKSDPTWWIIFGYILAAAGGLLGLVLGANLYYTKRDLPDGERVYRYEEKARKHGFWIMIISAIVLTYLMVQYFINYEASSI